MDNYYKIEETLKTNFLEKVLAGELPVNNKFSFEIENDYRQHTYNYIDNYNAKNGEIALKIAVHKSDIEAIDKLLALGADIKDPSQYLIFATHNASTLEYILSKGAPVKSSHHHNIINFIMAFEMQQGERLINYGIELTPNKYEPSQSIAGDACSFAVNKYIKIRKAYVDDLWCADKENLELLILNPPIPLSLIGMFVESNTYKALCHFNVREDLESGFNIVINNSNESMLYSSKLGLFNLLDREENQEFQQLASYIYYNLPAAYYNGSLEDIREGCNQQFQSFAGLAKNFIDILDVAYKTEGLNKGCDLNYSTCSLVEIEEDILGIYHDNYTCKAETVG